MDDRPDEPFEENFEPFELEGTPTGETRRVAPHPQEAPAARAGGGRGGPPTGVPCPSCGTHNPPFNRHCDSCGARLSQAPLPVAPQPMLRTTAGARALMVLAGVILTVALLALAVNVFRDGDGTVEPTTTSTTSQPPLDIQQLNPIRVDCTSQLPSFPCTALIDDNPDNSWNAQAGGVGTVLTFLFSPPVQIAEVIIYNLEDTARFERNARIKGIEIVIDDLPQAKIADLDDTNEPQRVQLRSLRTSSVTITITSAYPGQTYEGREPFPELAAQEIAFYGRVSPETTG
ncbi:MAG: hypothetical protein ABIJ48_11555 [Actinomycetota bacterium]